MLKENVVAGVDVGTTKIGICIGRASEGLINVIGYSSMPNAGVRKGMVVDVEDTVSAISAALEEAERMAGLPINAAIVSLGGAHISATTSKGVVAVSRNDGEISPNDVERVIEAARTVALPPNREIIHVIPRYFIVDGQENITDPVGMNGIRLEVESLVIGGQTSSIRNLTKCIHQAGLDIADMVFPPLASAKLLLTKSQKELGVAVVDVGGSTTSIAVFEGGDVLHCAVLPVGSMHITNDIAIGLRTSLEIAEKIKINYACAVPSEIRESETISLSQFDPQDDQRIERRYLAEITHARILEIFSLIQDELRKIGKDGMLPAGIIFTGGGSKLDGLVNLAKDELRLPAQIGEPTFEITGLVDKLDTAIYSTSIGLMLHGLETHKIPHQFKGGVFEKAKGFLKQFLP